MLTVAATLVAVRPLADFGPSFSPACRVVQVIRMGVVCVHTALCKRCGVTHTAFLQSLDGPAFRVWL